METYKTTGVCSRTIDFEVENGIINGSFTASLEDSSDFKIGDALCSVRVFERYSYTGSNRVSLSVTFFQNSNSEILISAITSAKICGFTDNRITSESCTTLQLSFSTLIPYFSLTNFSARSTTDK